MTGKGGLKTTDIQQAWKRPSSDQATQGSKKDKPMKTSKIDRLPVMFYHIRKSYVLEFRGKLVIST